MPRFFLRMLWGFWSRRLTIKFGVEHRILSGPEEDGGDLASLCRQYGSDKAGHLINRLNLDRPPHSYDRFYENEFRHRRFSLRHVLECGIGSNDPLVNGFMGHDAQIGASLRVWRDYLPNAEIVGVDIDPKCMFAEDRISTFQLDQLDSEAVKSFAGRFRDGHFDLVVDDGLHTFEAGIAFFENANRILAPNGLWVIEDVHIHDATKYQKYFNLRQGFTFEIHSFLRSRSDDRLIVLRRT